MIELLFVMALTILGVALTVFGVGMANGRRSRSGRSTSYLTGLEKVLMPLSKGIRTVAAGTAVVKGISNALDEDFLSNKQTETIDNAIEEYKLASENPLFATAKVMEPIIGSDKTRNLFNLYAKHGGYVPSAYLDSDAIRSASRLRSSQGYYRGSSLTPSESEVIYRTLRYGEEKGVDSGTVKISITDRLSNRTNRGTIETMGGKHYINIAKNMARSDQEETGEHEMAHILYPSATDAEIHRYLLDERLKDATKNYGKIMAQLSYLDELSKNPGAYKDENGDTRKYTYLIDEFKAISPKGKEMLEDKVWQKAFEKYRSVKDYSSLT